MSESHLWCPNCKAEVPPSSVTFFNELHEACGHRVQLITPEKRDRIEVLEAEFADVREQYERESCVFAEEIRARDDRIRELEEMLKAARRES